LGHGLGIGKIYILSNSWKKQLDLLLHAFFGVFIHGNHFVRFFSLNGQGLSKHKKKPAHALSDTPVFY
jgi:hypothetical protein